MTGIGSQHHPPASSVHSHGLKPEGVPTDVDEFNSGGKLHVSVVEDYALLIDTSHQVDYVLDIEGMAQWPVQHVSPSGEVHFRLL
ncbi:hypothetical protein D3C80_2077280 [compost metagenome]